MLRHVFRYAINSRMRCSVSFFLATFFYFVSIVKSIVLKSQVSVT